MFSKLVELVLMRNQTSHKIVREMVRERIQPLVRTHSVTDTNVYVNNNLGRYRDLVSGSVNKSRKHTHVGESDQVYIRNDARSPVTGPYPITKVRGPSVVVDMGQSHQGVVHIDRCKVSTPSSCQPAPLELENSESVPEPHLPFEENYDPILEYP